MNTNPLCADAIWAMIDCFRGYSFCKAHSASYAQISFESAYLRRHYPAEFMAAVISNCGGYYSTSAYISECMRMGLTILPIDINESNRHFKGNQKSIRIGFMAIKGLPSQTIDKILDERKRNGKYSSLYDYLNRTNTSLIDNQKLNHLGAFSQISPWNLSQIYWQMLEFYRSQKEDGQLQLFPISDKTPPYLNPPDENDILHYQMELLGFLVNQHSFILWEKQINKMNIPYQSSLTIPHYIGKKITLLGFPITKKIAQTRNGNKMAFYSFEDQHTLYDVTLFPKIYEKYKHFIVAETPCFLHGLVESEFNVETVTIDWIKKIYPSLKI